MRERERIEENINIYHHQHSSLTKLIAFFWVTSHYSLKLLSVVKQNSYLVDATKLLSEKCTQNVSKNKLNTRSQAVTFCHDFYIYNFFYSHSHTQCHTPNLKAMSGDNLRQTCAIDELLKVQSLSLKWNRVKLK